MRESSIMTYSAPLVKYFRAHARFFRNIVVIGNICANGICFRNDTAGHNVLRRMGTCALHLPLEGGCPHPPAYDRLFSLSGTTSRPVRQALQPVGYHDPSRTIGFQPVGSHEASRRVQSHRDYIRSIFGLARTVAVFAFSGTITTHAILFGVDHTG